MREIIYISYTKIGNSEYQRREFYKDEFSTTEEAHNFWIKQLRTLSRKYFETKDKIYNLVYKNNELSDIICKKRKYLEELTKKAEGLSPEVMHEV